MIILDGKDSTKEISLVSRNFIKLNADTYFILFSQNSKLAEASFTFNPKIKDQSLIEKIPSKFEIESSEENDHIIKKIPIFQEMIRKIKFKFLAHRLLSSTRSFMYKNLSVRQFQQIDDNAWQIDMRENKFENTDSFSKQNNVKRQNSNQITQKERENNFEKSNSFQRTIQWLIEFFKVFTILKFLNKYFPVVEPSSLSKIVWDFVQVIAILVYVIQIPLYTTFIDHSQYVFHKIIIGSIPIFILLDIVFCLNTGCYNKGCLIKRRSILFSINFKKVILPNIIIIACYLVFLIMQNSSQFNEKYNSKKWNYILLFSLILKLPDFGNIINKLQTHQILSKNYRNTISLLKLILTIVIITHIIACFWIKIGQIENEQSNNNWTKFNSLDNIEWYSIYINAFYFTMVTMTTVGYGDFVPVNEMERTVSLVIIVVSSGVFAYSMNTIGSILNSFNEDEIKKTLNMSIINSYMTRKNVSKQMKNQIREYLDYYWKEESERDQESEDKIINLLSDNLKKNLLMESKNVVLKKSAIFRNNFSDQVKEQIVPLIREYRCSPEEIICHEQEPDNCSIYFIEKGSVEIFIESNNSQQGFKPIEFIGKGQSFGELSFFTGKPRRANIRSREFTTLLILTRKEFLDVLFHHQDDYEKFCMIRDSIDIYENYSLINISCLSCKSESHLIKSCPYSHYSSNKNKMRQKFMFCPSQERGAIKRNFHRKSKSLINKALVEEISKYYQEDHDESIQYLNIQAQIKENMQFSSFSDLDHAHSSEKDDSKFEFEEEIQKSINIDYNNHDNFSRQISKQLFQENQEPIKEDNSNKEAKMINRYNSSQKDTIVEEDEDENNDDRHCSSKSKLPHTNDPLSQSTLPAEIKHLVQNIRINSFQSALSLQEQNGDKEKSFSRIDLSKSDSNKTPADNKLFKLSSIEILPTRRQKSLQNSIMPINRKSDKLKSLIGKPLDFKQDDSPSNNSIFKKNAFKREEVKQNSLVSSEQKKTFFKSGNGINEPSLQKKLSKFSIRTQEKHSTSNFQFPDNFDELLKMASNNSIDHNFDVMQNFLYYFPLNNISYQIELLGLKKEEKRRKMIWNSYDVASAVRFITTKKKSTFLKSQFSIVNEVEEKNKIQSLRLVKSKSYCKPCTLVSLCNLEKEDQTNNSLNNTGLTTKRKYQFSKKKFQSLESILAHESNSKTLKFDSPKFSSKQGNEWKDKECEQSPFNQIIRAQNQIISINFLPDSSIQQEQEIEQYMFQNEPSLNESINFENALSLRNLPILNVSASNFNLKSKRDTLKPIDNSNIVNFSNRESETEFDINQTIGIQIDEEKNVDTE